MPIQVAVLIVSYNSRHDLSTCLPAVLATDAAGLDVRTVVVDCASSDDSARYVEQNFPGVDLLRSEHNLGYAGGNNRGLEFVREHYPDTQYLAVLNPDTRVEPGWLAAMVQAMEADPAVAVVQAKLVLMDQPGRIDSAGNQSHVLGFGFVGGYGEPDDGRFDQPRPLAYASGAAMLVRIEALSGGALFDDEYFMYLEDAELGWRLRLAGRGVLYEPRAVVRHRHHPSRTTRHLYRLERNRWLLLLSCYKWPTLIALLPTVLLVEAMVIGYALGHGMLRDKVRSYAVVVSGHAVRRRREIQAARNISDRELLSLHTPRFDATVIRSSLLRRTVNLVMRGAWGLIHGVIRW